MAAAALAADALAHVCVCTLTFHAFHYPAIGNMLPKFLNFVFHAEKPALGAAETDLVRSR